ncbi:MAG: phytoene desaturase family protein [Thermoguttaceae bacterium]
MANIRDYYDVIIIGGGLGGMTAANLLARCGRSVLLLEQHHKLGGLATWFRRPGGHVFDVSLHGFPVGMIKSCRRYWNTQIADSIVQLKDIRFDNPQFTLRTTFDREDFTRLLTTKFQVPAENVENFFSAARRLNHFDDVNFNTGEFFEQFFPGRTDVVRLLMEPITSANGSTLEDPAVSYGIVFSNFMSKGVYTFQGGSDVLISMMDRELRAGGVDIQVNAKAEKIKLSSRRVEGVCLDGRLCKCSAVISNANLLGTIFQLVGEENFDADFIEQARAVRLNNSSTQVYMAFKPEVQIDPEACGDLLFHSTAPEFRADMILSRDITSRTFSFYYPKTRPGHERCCAVASTNANYSDWAELSPEDYAAAKRDLIDSTLDALAKYVPDPRSKIAHVEAATPRTFQRYTLHLGGASFGTKFEGLAVSRALPEHIAGLYHAGSVGIIMSGWLGAVNYGVIVANDVDASLMKNAKTA